MRFTVAFILSMAAAASAALSSGQVVANMDTLIQQSSETNRIAEAVIPANTPSTLPQLFTHFRTIITTTQNDIDAMLARKRSLQARQVCAYAEDPEQCLSDLSVSIDYPAEFLGSEKMKRQAQFDYSEADQQGICRTFRLFVEAQEELLKTMIERHDFFRKLQIEYNSASALTALGKKVDLFSLVIVHMVPTCSQDASQNKRSLDEAYDNVLATYSPKNN
ncbi:hypothetical protein BDV18DRAFT_160443 [Aspergillus unguis]